MRPSMSPRRQGQSRERVACSVGVDHQRGQGASQMSPPNAGRRDRDLYRLVRFRESRAQQSMKPMMLVRWFQRSAIWTSQSGILRCAWSLRDTTVKIKVRGHWNLHGINRWKTQYMKVVTFWTFLASY
jgi:hypothetical protein